MSRIFVIDVERRNWPQRIKRDSPPASAPLSQPGVTRRYLMIVEEPKIRVILQKEFASAPNAVYPHESGKDFMFYCIAGPSCRRSKKLVESIFYKLRKNNLDERSLKAIEVVSAA